MRIRDIISELAPVQSLGATPNPTAGTVVGPQAANLQDPKVNAALMAKQRQQAMQQKKQIQDQITSLTKQLNDLRKQLSQIK